jgi:Ca2+-binding RTX toxin-like protein
VRLKAGLMSPALHEGGGVYEAHPGAAGGDGLDTGRGKRGCLGSQRDRHQWSGHLEGTNGDDLSGSDANDVLWGGGGRDNLLGGLAATISFSAATNTASSLEATRT